MISQVELAVIAAEGVKLCESWASGIFDGGQVKVAPAGQATPEVPAVRPAAENEKPAAPKRLSLADLREANRRRRETAA
jgi:hypothetical protein